MKLRTFGLLLFILCTSRICVAQSLVPRAYVVGPVNSNAITLQYLLNSGSILFDPALPVTDTSGKLNTGVFSYYHSIDFFGRSANFVVSLPYTDGHFQGTVNGRRGEIYRSGLLDSAFRFSVNLKGGPAMHLQDIVKWKQKTIVGASLSIVAPTGQYDSGKVINPGTNRWAFKPELGLSHRRGLWLFDAYGGVWFYTTNQKFFSENQFTSKTNTFKQDAIFAGEAHISYDIKTGTWISLDCNYWRGGRTRVNGVLNVSSLQANSRIGVTGALRMTKHQSLKLSFSRGAITRIGGNFNVLSVGWQYTWLGKQQ